MWWVQTIMIGLFFLAILLDDSDDWGDRLWVGFILILQFAK